MKDINNLFFELIQVAIGTRICLSHTPTADEWGELYAMAKKQSLVGVCFAGVQKLQAQMQESPEMLYLTWMGMAAKIQQRNQIVDEQCVALQKQLSADGFRSCFLKGQGIARVYADHLLGLRQSGDIDVWIDSKKEKVIDYVMAIAPTAEFDQKHIHYHFFEDTDIEMHWIPVKRYNPLRNKIRSDYFESQKVRQFSHQVGNLVIPTADFQLIHQIMHVYGHYLYEGVGFRQVMDCYFALLACSGNNSLVLPFLKRIKLMRFVAALMWVMQEVMTLPIENMLCEPDEKEGKLLLNSIILGGNFGHYDANNKKINESFIEKLLRRWGRKLRLIRYDPIDVICMPFQRTLLEVWMHKTRRKYHVI